MVRALGASCRRVTVHRSRLPALVTRDSSRGLDPVRSIRAEEKVAGDSREPVRAILRPADSIRQLNADMRNESMRSERIGQS